MIVNDLLESIHFRLQQCRSVSDVGSILRSATQDFELKHVAYFFGGVPTQGEGKHVLLTSYPEEWVRHYFKSCYQSIDPAAALCSRSVLPKDWSELRGGSSLINRMFNEASEIGVGVNGVTIPIRGPHGDAAVCSFTSDESGRNWRSHSLRLMPYLQSLSHHIHQRICELNKIGGSKLDLALSPRESDCLKLCAAGLNDPEIADRLRISRNVVSKYLESARYKLNARTRTYAVVRAIKLGIIPPETL